VPIPLDQLPDDAEALKRIIATMAQDAVTAQAEIAKLRFQLARYRRAEFGRSSEKLEREADQLELAIETLEADRGSGWPRSRRSWRQRSRPLANHKSRPGVRCRSICRARI